MLEFLKHVLTGQNQFASSGLLLMIIGGIGVYLRALPLRLCSWCVKRTTMMITVNDDDAAFAWVKEWFLEQEFLKRIRHLDVDTSLRGEGTALVPAPGSHWFWRCKRPFWVWFSRSEETKGWVPRRMESLTFRTIGRDQVFLKQFVDEIVACHKRRVRLASQLYQFDDGWSCVQAYKPRRLTSVILKSGEKEHLIQDVEKFRASRNRYRDLGVPYHRGYLLYGPPGTGKTSLISGLAARFGMSIYAVNLTDFNDRTLKSAVNDVPENSVILFEDIDGMKTGDVRSYSSLEQWPRNQGPHGNERSSASDPHGVTLSGLLSVLDGFNAPENVLFAMTTNRMEVLDPALLRPGRIDYRLYMGKAAESQKTELYCRFFPNAAEVEAREFVRSNSADTMAEFQGLLLALEQQEKGLDIAELEAGGGVPVSIGGASQIGSQS